MIEQVHAIQAVKKQLSIFDMMMVLVEVFVFVTSEVFLILCEIFVTLNAAYDRFDEQMCRIEDTIARFPSRLKQRIECYLRKTFMAAIQKFTSLIGVLRGSDNKCHAVARETETPRVDAAAEQQRKEQHVEMERQKMQRARILAQQQKQRQYEAKQKEKHERNMQQARIAEHHRQGLVLERYVRFERARMERREKRLAEEAKHRVLEPLVKSQAQIDREIELWNDVNRPNVNEERRLKRQAAKAAREAAAQRKEEMRREEMARIDALPVPQQSFVIPTSMLQAAQTFMATVAPPCASAQAVAALSDEEAAALKAEKKAKKLARKAKEKAEKEQLEYFERIFA